VLFVTTDIIFIQDSQNSGLMNGSAEMEHAALDNSIAEEEGEGESVETSKGHAWERGKAPWVEELKLNQAKKSSGLNSTAAVLGQSPPEQTERKLPKSKLDPSKLQLTMILGNNQLDALFHVFIYFMSLRVSSVTALIIRRSNCIITSSGMISLCK